MLLTSPSEKIIGTSYSLIKSLKTLSRGLSLNENETEFLVSAIR
tara:strand:+ start:103 stop:234 length:132 start_codon:yes stop_codon:yes gene_type:complete